MRITSLNLSEKGLGYRHFRPKGKEGIPGAESSIILANSSNEVDMHQYASSSNVSFLLNPIVSDSPPGPIDNFLLGDLEGTLEKIVPSMEDSVSKIEGLIEKICVSLGSFASQEEIDYAGLKFLQAHWVAVAKVCIVSGNPR